MKVKSQSEVAQSCPTLSNLMDGSLPGSSVHGIFQARVLEWGAIAFSMLGVFKYWFQGLSSPEVLNKFPGEVDDYSHLVIPDLNIILLPVLL